MDSNKPYGDVKYADPGYQDDGKKRYPLDSEAHCRAAWSYINQEHNAAMYSAKELAAIKKRIMAAGKDYGIEFDDEDHEPMGPEEDEPMGRRSATPSGLEIMRYERVWNLEDITIQRGGDGRTVEAYAAIWDTPAEVRDQHGHYMETISRGAFDKFIRERGKRDIPVYFNHGMTAAGTPSDIYSVPIGRSLEIRAESRGLWTLSRYNDGPDVDRVLEAIRNGAITAQSFRGRVYKSDPPGPIRRRTGDLPTVTRTELGLSEYGPTPSAVYDGAAILALRSRSKALGIDLDQLLDELVRRTSTTPSREPETVATSEPEAGADEPPTEALRSAVTDDYRRVIELARIRGVL